jgi:hypothetical protein
MILLVGNALVSARTRKVSGDDLTSSVMALQIDDIAQKRCTEDSRSADHGRADGSDS